MDLDESIFKSYVPDDVPKDRCGFTTNYDESLFPGPGDVTCWRESWSDHNRCIWHADIADKPVDGLAATRTTNPERLDGAVLREADLQDTISFAECVLIGADCTDANLSWADLTGVKLWEAALTDADLFNTDLTDANLAETNLTNAFFQEADLTNAFVQRADLTDAYFERADLTMVDFTDADLTAAFFRFADLTDATLSGADLTSAILTQADLVDASLRGVDLTNSLLEDADLTAASLERADLTSAFLKSADLTDASLRGADLTGANLHEVRLEGVELSQATTFGQPDDWSELVSEVDEMDEKWNQVARTQHLLRWAANANGLTGKARRRYVYERHARSLEALANDQYYDHVISRLSWMILGYGVSVKRVFKNMVYVVFASTLAYMFVDVGRHNMAVREVVTLSVPSSELLAALHESFYFSIITFTTVGYGDLQPATRPARQIAITEALLGTILVVVLSVVLANRESP